MERARRGEELTVDLEANTAGGFPFALDDFTRECLLEGLDEIALTLRDENAAIAAYEARHAAPVATTAL
jgi:3-isopropylmalate/(R)-2-methylmalate dehydratase small subunit